MGLRWIIRTLLFTGFYHYGDNLLLLIYFFFCSNNRKKLKYKKKGTKLKSFCFHNKFTICNNAPPVCVWFESNPCGAFIHSISLRSHVVLFLSKASLFYSSIFFRLLHKKQEEKKRNKKKNHHAPHRSMSRTRLRTYNEQLSKEESVHFFYFYFFFWMRDY